MSDVCLNSVLCRPTKIQYTGKRLSFPGVPTRYNTSHGVRKVGQHCTLTLAGNSWFPLLFDCLIQSVTHYRLAAGASSTCMHCVMHKWIMVKPGGKRKTHKACKNTYILRNQGGNLKKSRGKRIIFVKGEMF